MIKPPSKSIRWKTAFENPRKVLDAMQNFIEPARVVQQGSSCPSSLEFGSDKYWLPQSDELRNFTNMSRGDYNIERFDFRGRGFLIGIINEGKKKIGVFAIDIPYEWCNTPCPEYGSSIGEEDIHRLPLPIEDSIELETKYERCSPLAPEEECMSFTYDWYEDEHCGHYIKEYSGNFESKSVNENIDQGIGPVESVDEDVLSEILSIKIAKLSAQEPYLQEGLRNFSSSPTVVEPENMRRNSCEFNPFFSFTNNLDDIFSASIDESFTEGLPSFEAREQTIMSRIECIHNIDTREFRNNPVSRQLEDFISKKSPLVDKEEYMLDPDMASHVSSLDTETHLEKQREQVACNKDTFNQSKGTSMKKESKEEFNLASYYEEYLTSVEDLLLPRPLFESLPQKMENRRRYRADGLPPFEFSHAFDVLQEKCCNDGKQHLEANGPNPETHRERIPHPAEQLSKLRKRSYHILERYDRDLRRLIDRAKSIQTQRSLRLFLQVHNSEVEARSELEDLIKIMKINKDFHLQSLKDLFDDFSTDSSL